MNPWAAVILLIAFACIVIGVKGTEDNLVAAITGKRYNNSTLS